MKEDSALMPVEFIYSTRAIITRSRFETALDFKPRILGPTFFGYVQMVFDINLSCTEKWGKKYTNRGL